MRRSIAWASTLLALISATAIVATGNAVASDSSTPSVLIVEAVESNLGYGVVLGGPKSGPSEDVMAALRKGLASGPRVAVLVGPDVPVRAFTTIRSMASKVGYARENIRFFAFDRNKRGMVAVHLALVHESQA